MKSVRQSIWLATLGGVVGLILVADACMAQDMTGTWYNTESVFSIRQVDSDVYIVCQSAADNGSSWTSVFTGRLKDGKVHGTYASVPLGANRDHGTFSADLIVESGKVTAIAIVTIEHPSKERRTYTITPTKPK